MTVDEDHQTYRFTREKYYLLAELGFFHGRFHDQRVELIDGEILFKPRHSGPNASSLAELLQIFAWALPPGKEREFQVRPQFQLSISDVSDPEPDLAIVEKKPGVMRGEHPCTANLVIEVADPPTARDHRKISLYASAAVPEYWIVDVTKKQVTVYTEPVIAPEKEFGADYKQSRVVGINDQIKPVALPMEAVAVKRFF